MEFAQQQQRRMRGEDIVPMINVVFLLLIFFLMTAQIAPPDPLDVTPPQGVGETVAPGDTLFIAADGALAFGDARGAAVFAALAGRDAAQPLVLRADAGVPGARLAALLARLAQAGQGQVLLVVGGS
ncbi:ExbD/TolR family protein [Actibacterium sp. D379-3]